MASKSFVGHAAEIEKVTDALKQAVSGKGSGILIRGGAGIGKTTILKVIANNTTRSQIALVLGARCLPVSSEGSAYQPFVQIMNQVNKKGRDWKKLTSTFLQDIAPEWLNMIPVVGAGLSATAKTTGWIAKEINLSEEEKQKQMQVQFLRFLKSSSEKLGPLLLIIDDIQWLDQSSAALWLYVMEYINKLPILLLASYRDDLVFDTQVQETEAFERVREVALRRKFITEITIHELDLADVKSFLAQEIPSADVIPDATAQWLFKESGGNPFFLKQIVEYAFQIGVMEVKDKQLYVDGVATTDLDKNHHYRNLPDTVQQVILERLRHFTKETNTVLRYASVQGDEFLTAVLASTLDEDELKLLYTLRELRDIHHVIDNKENFGTKLLTDNYVFLHRIVWQTIYSQLTEREKVLLHKLVAQHFETHFSDLLAANNEMLLMMSKHWEQAGQYFNAASYMLKAAIHAKSAHLYSEAIAHRNRGLALLSNLPTLDVPAQTLKFDLLALLIIRLIQQGKIADDILDEMRTLAEQVKTQNDVADVYMWQYWLNNVKGNVEKAYSSAEAARQIRKKLGLLLGEAEAIAGMCKMMARRGELTKVAPLYDEAINLYKEGLKRGEVDDEDWIFFYLNRSYALAMTDFGDYERSIQYFKVSVTRAEAKADWFQTVEALAHLTESYIFIGQHDLAREAAQKGIGLSVDKSIGKWQRLECELHLGTLAMNKGDIPTALNIFEAGEATALEEGGTGWWEIVYIKYSLALLAMTMNQAKAAVKVGGLGEDLIILADKQGFLHAKVQGLTCKALGLLGNKMPQDALQASQEANDIIKRVKYLVATPTEQILYVHYKILDANGLTKEAAEQKQAVESEINRKLGLIKTTAWKDSYLEAVKGYQQLINNFVHA